MYLICIVQHFEPQGRHFINFLYYYYLSFNAGWTTSMSGCPCSCQNCSQWSPKEKTRRASLLNLPSCPPWWPSRGTELNRTSYPCPIQLSFFLPLPAPSSLILPLLQQRILFKMLASFISLGQSSGLHVSVFSMIQLSSFQRRLYTPQKSSEWDHKPRSPLPPTPTPTPPCVYIYMHAKRSHTHVKDPVAHVRVWWVMETLKHQACAVGWVAWLSQPAFTRESNPNFWRGGGIPMAQ